VVDRPRLSSITESERFFASGQVDPMPLKLQTGALQPALGALGVPAVGHSGGVPYRRVGVRLLGLVRSGLQVVEVRDLVRAEVLVLLRFDGAPCGL
jgi:hypothetical protein